YCDQIPPPHTMPFRLWSRGFCRRRRLHKKFEKRLPFYQPAAGPSHPHVSITDKEDSL
ncbi:hypothetical protein L9F63_001754, partial [Diploptera punctata]